MFHTASLLKDNFVNFKKVARTFKLKKNTNELTALSTWDSIILNINYKGKNFAFLKWKVFTAT